MTFDAEIADFSEEYANEETGVWTVTAWIRSDMFYGIYYLPVSGRLEGESGMDVDCSIYSPFNVNYTIFKEPGEPLVYSCIWALYHYGDSLMAAATALPDDKCPDGFYTVPYDVSCGVGFVDTTDIPNCSDDTSGPYCLMSRTVPCASGITVLRTSSGVSVPLWGDKQTSPAIHVRYNDVTCYGNLESGQSANAINLKYNGTVYHTIN
ncbi:MAG: hypothetical protein IJD52_03685 [Alphaproteobacteria bacterium]|nr:hypothetical protein [Alphaproteobacteria bacterium]